MMQVILVIHMLIAVAIIALVLLQRSEGGGILGSGGGGLGGFATPQATANALTKATWVCITGFFITSLALGVLAGQQSSRQSILDRLDAPVAGVTAPAEAGTKPPATESKAPSAPAKPSEPTVPTSE